MTCFSWNSGACKNPNFLRSYLCKYSEKSFEIWMHDLESVFLKWVFFLASETSQKKVIAKIPRWPVWSSETLESRTLIPNVMKLAHKRQERNINTLEFSLFEGAASFTLHKWKILIWYKWQDLLSIYRSLRGHNTIRVDITIIM